MKASRNPRIISAAPEGRSPLSESARCVLAMTRVERGKKKRRVRLSLSLSSSTPSLSLLQPSFIPLPSLCETGRPPLLALRGTTTKRHRTPSFATPVVEKLTIDYRNSCVDQRARTLPPSGRKCRLPRGGHLCEVLPAIAAAAAAAATAAVAVPVVVVAP